MEHNLYCLEKEYGTQIACFLKMLEETQEAAFMEESPYTESLLSLEIKEYFTACAGGQTIPEEEAGAGRVLQRICRIFDLDDFEKMCLELCVLGEINPYFEKFFIYMNNDWNAGYLTFGTAVSLYTMSRETHVEYYRYFEKEGKLASCFLDIIKPEGKSRVRWGFCCRSAFFSFILSEQPSAGVYEGAAEWLPGQEEGAAEQRSRREQSAAQELEPSESQDTKQQISGYVLKASLPIIQKLDRVLEIGASAFLCGLQKEEGLALLKQYMRQRKQPVCFLDIQMLAAEEQKGREEGRNLSLDILMQAVYHKAFLCVFFLDEKFAEKEENRRFADWLKELMEEHALSFLFLGGRGCMEWSSSKLWEISIGREELAADAGMWKQLAAGYPLEEEVCFEFYANNYGFTQYEVTQALMRAERSRILQNRRKISQRDLKESCISQAKYKGNHLVTVINAAYSFEDLVLPEQQMKQLKAACNRIRYKARVFEAWGYGEKLAYGRGVSMVFSGPPGTGKSMSAQAAANTLGTALYRVDLSAVVSKYIGETEKNLHTVFEIAGKGHGVLFFDEADVLFTKRTEVKDSHDKHSNMEAAYLLQKMEEYEGVVILATNYMQNMDEAFKRRISFWIEFPLPDEACRLRLWKKAFPRQVEFDQEPDYAFLAKQFELSGSHIKNIALQAAFFAAEENRAVGMEQIIHALLAEAKKEGRRISREALWQYEIYHKSTKEERQG